MSGHLLDWAFHGEIEWNLLLLEAFGGLLAISNTWVPLPKPVFLSAPFPKSVDPGTGTAFSPLAPNPLRVLV